MKEEMSGGGSLKDKEAMQTLGKVTKETARKSTAAVSHAVEVKRIPTLTDESDSETKEMHVCKVCGSCFETRRGLSSHARSHLRQLGVSVSDSSGMPIDLLYKLIRDRDGKLPLPPTRLKFPQKTQHKTHSPKKDSGTKLKIKISNLVKKKYNKPSTSPKVLKEWTSSSQTSSPLLHPKSRLATPQVKKVPVSPILLTPSLLSGADSRFNTGSPSTSLAIAKPHWAPQETDAPLNLMMMDTSSRDDVHVCELCGAWYETRKGLSSHARAHLRQLGVENVNAKGAPIELLHEIIHNKDFQEGGGVPRPHSLTPTPCTPPSKLALVLSPERSGCKTPASSPLLSSSPPAKKAKPSPEGRYSDDVSLRSASGKKKHSHGGSGKSVRCEFCRETFKKSQSLASHARSHLRQLGITEWTVRGSPMATLREVMARRGPSATLDPPPPASSLPSLPPSVPSSPVSLPPVPPSPALSSDPSSLPPPPKVPKARKGSRTVSKPKDEPVEMDVCRVESPGARPYMPCGPTTQTWTPDPNISPSLIAAPKSEQEPLQLVSCDYCGDDFPSRKAFSCHARAHLRQLGVRWSANSSPIDTLTQLMHREGRQRAPHVKVEPGADLASQRKVPANSPRAFTPSPAPDDSALKERTASDSMGAQSACDATCELCGFDFENRKALASHARAHLRQLGVEWHVHGSPIETLNAWMQREPGKVAELHRRYMQGDLPRVRKRSTSSPYTSSDSEAARTALHRPPFAQRSSQGQQAARTVAGVASGSSSAAWGRVDHSLSSQKKRQSQGASQITYHFQPSPVAHSELNVRVPRGFERRPPKHLAHTESRTRESGPPKPQRLGNIPSLVPPPPPTTLVKLVGKVYSLKCRFCEEVFRGPLSVQEDWVMHLQEHIRNLKQDAHTAGPPPLSTGPAHATVSMATAPPLIGPQAV